MIDDKRIIRLSLVIGLVIAGLSCLFSSNYAAGIVLGLLSFQLYYRLLNIQYTIIFNELENVSLGIKILMVLNKPVRIILLIAPGLLAGLYPQYLNIFFTFLGQLLFKIVLYGSVFWQNICKKKGE